MAEYARRSLGCLNKERGQILVEYSLILAFVLIACVAVLGTLGIIIAGHIDSFTFSGVFS